MSWFYRENRTNKNLKWATKLLQFPYLNGNLCNSQSENVKIVLLLIEMVVLLRIEMAVTIYRIIQIYLEKNDEIFTLYDPTSLSTPTLLYIY